MATAYTPPRTPTARKSLPGSPSAISPNGTAAVSPTHLQKRKWQGGSLALPLPGLTHPGNSSGSAPVAPMGGLKRQKIEEYVKLEEQPQHQQHLSVPTTPPQVPDSLPHPAAKPMFNQQSSRQPNMQHIVQPSMHPAQQPLQATIPQQIFMATFKRNHTLMPVAPTTEPIGSRRVDAIAHGCWDVVFSKEALMTDITMKAAFYTPLKLRALARLNWLPSWWFLREMAVSLMKQQGWMIDDSERMGEWHEAVDWCKKAEMKCFGGGADAGAGAATQDVGLCATQIQELQAAAAAAATKQVES